MLVLSRKRNQVIKIGDSVTIRVGRISGDRVSIGIEAPKDVTVVRGELRPNPKRSESCPKSTLMSSFDFPLPLDSASHG